MVAILVLASALGPVPVSYAPSTPGARAAGDSLLRPPRAVQHRQRLSTRPGFTASLWLADFTVWASCVWLLCGVEKPCLG